MVRCYYLCSEYLRRHIIYVLKSISTKESFRMQNVDGPLLLSLDETFLREKVLVQNALMRKKVLRQVQLLKEQRDAIVKV